MLAGIIFALSVIVVDAAAVPGETVPVLTPRSVDTQLLLTMSSPSAPVVYFSEYSPHAKLNFCYKVVVGSMPLQRELTGQGVPGTSTTPDCEKLFNDDTNTREFKLGDKDTAGDQMYCPPGVKRSSVVTTTEIATPWANPTEALSCADGSFHPITTNSGWFNCGPSGGRSRCPSHWPYMCASKNNYDNMRNADYWCKQRESDCRFFGGLRPFPISYTLSEPEPCQYKITLTGPVGFTTAAPIATAACNVGNCPYTELGRNGDCRTKDMKYPAYRRVNGKEICEQECTKDTNCIAYTPKTYGDYCWLFGNANSVPGYNTGSGASYVEVSAQWVGRPTEVCLANSRNKKP